MAARRPIFHRVDPILRASLPPSGLDIWNPEAVPLYDAKPNDRLWEEYRDAREAAVEEFCLLANLSREEVVDKIFTEHGWNPGYSSVRDSFTYSCFLLRLMVSVCRNDDDGIDDPLISRIRAVAVARRLMVSVCRNDDDGIDDPVISSIRAVAVANDNGGEEEEDLLMSRAEVHTRIDAIVRDVMLLENQIPWQLLVSLMELLGREESGLGLGDCAGNYVDRFLALVASFFDAGGHGNDEDHHQQQQAAFRQLRLHRGADDPPLDHLLGIFHRHQMMAGGSGSTVRRRVPMVSSVSSTAVELAEMGVKLAASKTKVFGDMSLVKRQWRRGGLGLFGELSLAPVVLNDMTACWLMNMAAYEVGLGATVVDNYAVCSYISMVAILINREEDVQELRAKGIINSAMSDKATLDFFKWAAPRLRLGRRYYDVFQGLQEYRSERWLWISIHRFLYKNSKTIITVLSIIGVLAGLFKTLLSLKQPQPQPR